MLKYATTHNYPRQSTTTHNHLKNHPQPSTTTQKLPKKAKTCHKQLCYCTLDVNTETDVGFDSDMKQWYIYMCVCVYVCILYKSLYLLFFWLADCFCQHYKFIFSIYIVNTNLKVTLTRDQNSKMPGNK